MVLNRYSAIRPGLICGLVIIVLLSACSTNSSSPPTTAKKTVQVPTPTSAPVLGATGCHPPSTINYSATGFPEVQGTPSGRGVELWALLFNDVPFPVRQEVKIVWRMTGSADLQLVALGPGGSRVTPKWLTYHPSSNWNRPGAEWGSGFIFPKAGCWDLHATRGSSSGDVWLLVQ